MSWSRQGDRSELGAFLRAHREQLRPSEVGLEESSRRRTPGLRREEVATLAGLGLTWYAWLEQGRVTPSKQVLGAVARALRLSVEETAHVMALAGFRMAEWPDLSGEAIAKFRTLTEGWVTSPAALVDRHLDMLAWNEAYARVWPDPTVTPPLRRNLLFAVLDTEALAVRPPDRSSMAWGLTRQLRAHAARSPDKRFGQLYKLLEQEHPELGAWWRCKSVGEYATGSVVVRGINFMTSMLHPADAPDCAVLVHAPTSDADRARLARLLSGGLQQAG